MIEKGTLEFAIDGVLIQSKLAMDTLAEGTKERLAVQAIMASVQTLRALVVEGVPDGEPGECPHPPNALLMTRVGGGNFVTTCTMCNTIVEQS